MNVETAALASTVAEAAALGGDWRDRTMAAVASLATEDAETKALMAADAARFVRDRLALPPINRSAQIFRNESCVT